MCEANKLSVLLLAAAILCVILFGSLHRAVVDTAVRPVPFAFVQRI